MQWAGEKTGKQLDGVGGASLAVTVLPVVHGGPPCLVPPLYPSVPLPQSSWYPQPWLHPLVLPFVPLALGLGPFFFFAMTHGMQDLP